MLLFKKMKSISKLLSILIFIGFFFVNPAYSLELDYKNEYLVDIRADDGDICLNRLSFHKKLDYHDIELSYFLEGQWNLEINDWEKVMFGIEFGKTFLKYLYIGQTLQVTSGQILDYMAFDTNSKTIDATTKMALRFPLSEKLSLYIFEEYVLNPIKGRDEYSEVGTELNYRPKESFSFGIGWRHTDRIHALDTDYITSSFTLHF